MLVSDIGCSGLSDQYFVTSAFHGLHGRSITYATGIKLARPDLTVIVIMGDGGTGIGGAHLLSAARRNIGLTVLVFNNFNFGMTGGQHSTTTPPGAITATTPGGNLERPLDICATVAANGAGYVWRGTSFDKDLPDRIAEAVNAECFALLDIWELCTAYYVPQQQGLEEDAHRRFSTTCDLKAGLLHRAEYPEYAAAYRAASAPLQRKAAAGTAPDRATVLRRARSSVPARGRGLGGRKGAVLGALVGEAALLSGLWAAQRDDYPITVMTGHSIAELVLSPREIEYTGITAPDAMILLSQDGVAKVGRQLAAMKPDDRVFAVPEVAGVETSARVSIIDPAHAPAALRPGQVALYCIALASRELGLVPPGALDAAATRRASAHAAENAATILAAGATASEPAV